MKYIKNEKISFIVLSIISFCIASCSNSNLTNKAPELIEFRTIEANSSDTVAVQELFYKDQYNLTFLLHEFVKTTYDPRSKHLIISPYRNFEGFTVINFLSNGIDMVIPIIVKKKSEAIFSYKPTKKVNDVFVMGNFNDWNRSGNRMLDEDKDGIYFATVYLDDGVYEYQFVVDKREFPDPNNPEKVDNGFGSFNSVKRVRSLHKEQAPNLFLLPRNSDKTIQLAIETRDKQQEVKLHVLFDNKLYPETFYNSNQNVADINLHTLKALNGLHALRIVATIDNIPGNILTLWLKDGVLLPAADQCLWNDAIIYSLMIDRFLNGNKDNDKPVSHPELSNQVNFNGGDFCGVTHKIKEGYFDSLGINTLWISPINKTTDKAFQEWPEPHRFYSGYHGYWPIAARETEPRFGSLQEFKELVETAHSHKIKILLDFISNHTHMEHTYYKNNPEWYGKVDLPNGEKNIRRWDEYRLTTWFDTFLPSFDFENNPDAIDAVTDDAIWWLENTGIDGFRHDATKHVPYSFWKVLTHKIKSQINPKRNMNVYQIGETFGSHYLIKSYVNSSMLNAQFNFNQFFIARRVFSDENSDFRDLNSAIQKAFEVYGYNHLMGNIMDSHDQVRMMALFDGDMTLSEDAVERAFHDPRIEVDHLSSYKKELLYYIYILTIPGIPIIYYSDEYGGTGAGDPDNRRMMRFDSSLKDIEKKQLKKVSAIVNLRKKHSALRRGDFKTLFVSDHTMIYMRGDYIERLIIALNKSADEESVSLSLPEWIESTSLVSLLDGKVIPVKDKIIQLNIPPYSGDVMMIRY